MSLVGVAREGHPNSGSKVGKVGIDLPTSCGTVSPKDTCGNVVYNDVAYTPLLGLPRPQKGARV